MAVLISFSSSKYFCSFGKHFYFTQQPNFTIRHFLSYEFDIVISLYDYSVYIPSIK
jgi:hypothetical protein